MFSPVLAFTLFALGAHSISVTAPQSGATWQSGTSGQTVSWEAVSTDPTSFAIQLVNQAGFLPNSPVTLVSNQSTGAAGQTNSVTVTYPSGNWPAGSAFQINLVQTDSSSSAILAQSQQFNISNSGGTVPTSATSSSSTSSGLPPTTISMSRASTSAVTGQNVGTSAAAGSSGVSLPNAVTSTNSADMILGTPGAFISALMAVAALMGVTI